MAAGLLKAAKEQTAQSGLFFGFGFGFGVRNYLTITLDSSVQLLIDQTILNAGHML
jgi:hypothetical protein